MSTTHTFSENLMNSTFILELIPKKDSILSLAESNHLLKIARR